MKTMVDGFNTFISFMLNEAEHLTTQKSPLFKGVDIKGMYYGEILNNLSNAQLILNNFDTDIDENFIDFNLFKKCSIPFKTCWISHKSDKRINFKYKGYKYNAVGLFLTEMHPNVYAYSLFFEKPNDFDSYGHLLNFINFNQDKYIPAEPEDSEVYKTIYKYLFAFIGENYIGVQKINEHIRVKKSNGEKLLYKIKKIIHLIPKSNKIKNEISNNININWTHRWAVRGHWRKISGIGKDRERNHIIDGFTWVVEHVKGPDERPYIKKIRIVDDSFLRNNIKNTSQT